MQNKYIAEIIDNADPDLEGKVQIYIAPLHYGFKPDQYIWAKQDREWSSFIPEIGDLVWVYFFDGQFHRQAYYTNPVDLKDSNSHNQTIGSMTGAYPDVKYVTLANGVSIALNSNQTEATIKVGNAEIYIDPTGLISIKNATWSLKTLVDALIDAIKSLGTTGSPVAHTINPASQLALEAEKLKWAQFTK